MEILYGPRNSTPRNQESDRVKAPNFQTLGLRIGRTKTTPRPRWGGGGLGGRPLESLDEPVKRRADSQYSSVLAETNLSLSLYIYIYIYIMIYTYACMCIHIICYIYIYIYTCVYVYVYVYVCIYIYIYICICMYMACVCLCTCNII